jgi:cyclophilin family peptidyl-prolyl cis-trans isomerase
MMMNPRRLFFAAMVSHVVSTLAWQTSCLPKQDGRITRLCMKDDNDNDSSSVPRRRFLNALMIGGVAVAGTPLSSQAVASRAVGSGEIACREAGNCMEKGEWDGAVGWNWGAKDRCDAADPLCGADGQLRDEIIGKPVPRPSGTTITHAVAIQLNVGRAESGVLKLGLYGEDCPMLVQQLIAFLSPTGLTVASEKSNSMGKMSTPVSLAVGGIVDSIVPGLTIDFGVPSQANAYARAKGMTKAGDNFAPQPRPKVDFSSDKTVRPHDTAGLVSIASNGLGYGGTGFESDDETFESSFLITNSAVPSLDKAKAGRRVVGQVLDVQSMAFLERLASLPTKKGFKGVIPGQTSGPPLIKVTVSAVQVSAIDGARPNF